MNLYKKKCLIKVYKISNSGYAIFMNIKALQTFLDQASIPSVKQQPKTFLEIARQPHYENVISNIYAFYFDNCLQL